MPIYEFRCRECNHVFEEFVFSSSFASNEMKCPECGHQNSEKLLSAFSSADSGSTFTSGNSGSCGSSGFS